MSHPLAGTVVLITGATGFVGSVLARRAAAIGAKVHVLLRSSNTWRIDDLLEDEAVTAHRVDLLEAAKLRDVVSEVRPRTVFHCATYGGYPAQSDAERILMTNVIGTGNLIAATEGFDIALIATGSSSEYGLKDQPMAEGDPLEPVSTYGASKAAATLLLQTAARERGLRTLIVRIFSAYGPYEEPTRLVPTVIRSCLDGRDPELTGGDQPRDFTYVGDLADLFLRAATSNWQAGTAVNVGSGVQRPVRDIVERIVALTGADVKPRFGALPKRRFEARCWVADTTLVEQLFGAAPAADLDRGLLETIEWARAQREEAVQ